MIPALGKAGKYKLSPPFQIDETVSYVCRGVSFIQSLVDKNIDVYNDFYVPVGLSEAEYNEDLDTDESIVTLKSSDGNILNVPSSYITQIPTDEEVPYSRFGVLFEFGILPNETAFENLVTQMQDISKSTLGVEPDAALTLLPYDGFVTKEEHKLKLKEREVNIEYNASPRLQLQESLQREQSLKQRILALEQALIKLQS